ncbi:MAG TPA: galactosyltransferase-related protein [Phycisphaerales bacterium]|nr:galactosyltransferase-related protein [Phycisphaerales bacterium]
MPAVHLLLNTHTPLRLRRTLLGVACQTAAPASITLSCDSDDPAIEAAAREGCREFGLSMTLIRRAHTGVSRSAQVRNNAVRSLVDSGAAPDSLLLFFDGDCVPEPRAIEKHLDLTAKHPNPFVVLGWRYDLTEAQDKAFDEAAMRRGEWPVAPTAEQRAALEKRRKRFSRQLFLKRLGFSKPHKPKLLSAHFSLRLRDYLAINGFDETYESYGQEDDDLGRRLYANGVSPLLAITSIACFHQFHVTRQPPDWHATPNAQRLMQSFKTVCDRGVRNPLDQPPVTAIRIGN